MNSKVTNPVRTLTECYAQFGIEIKNPRSAWSAQTPKGRTVVTLWTQHFRDDNFRIYSTFGTLRRLQPVAGRKRTEHLKAVGVGGTFDAIVITPADISKSTWRIISRQIGGEMRLTQLDEITGEFAAERLEE